jgi:hypothetical protein
MGPLARATQILREGKVVHFENKADQEAWVAAWDG